MKEWSFVWSRMIRAAIEAPWWKTFLVALGTAGMCFLGPKVVALLGKEENVLLNVLAALWWLPLLLLGFLSAVAFLQQAKGRWRRTKQRSAERRGGGRSGFNSGRRS